MDEMAVGEFNQERLYRSQRRFRELTHKYLEARNLSLRHCDPLDSVKELDRLYKQIYARVAVEDQILSEFSSKIEAFQKAIRFWIQTDSSVNPHRH